MKHARLQITTSKAKVTEIILLISLCLFLLITYCIKGVFCVLQAAIVICQCDELRVRFMYRFKAMLR